MGGSRPLQARPRRSIDRRLGNRVSAARSRRLTLTGKRALAAILAAAVCATEIAAQSSDPQRAIAVGIRAYEEGDLDGAVDSLSRAVRVLASDPGRSRDLARAHLYLGAAYLLLRQDEAGRASFREAVRADPGLKPDSARFPPKVVRTFGEVTGESGGATGVAIAGSRAPNEASGQKSRSPQSVAEQTKALLVGAEKALETRDYDTAIARYDEALRLDPTNQIAVMGRATAFNARVTTQAIGAGSRPTSGKVFVGGKTTRQSDETRAAQNLPPGFRSAPDMAVTRDTQSGDLPGEILFEVDPAAVAPGDNYTIKILLANAGLAPIEIKNIGVRTVINGKRAVGNVPSLARAAAPKQRTVLASFSDVWRGDVKTWSMEVTVHTSAGASYRNELVWK